MSTRKFCGELTIQNTGQVSIGEIMQTIKLTAKSMELENITFVVWVNWIFRFYLFHHLFLFDRFSAALMSKYVERAVHTAAAFHWITFHYQKRMNVTLKFTFALDCNWPRYMHWKLAHLRSTHFPNIFINIHKFSELFVTIIILQHAIQFSINIQLAQNGTVSVFVSVHFGILWQKSWKLDDCKLKKFSQCHHIAPFDLSFNLPYLPFFTRLFRLRFFSFIFYSSKIIWDCFPNPVSFTCYCTSEVWSEVQPMHTKVVRFWKNEPP